MNPDEEEQMNMEELEEMEELQEEKAEDATEDNAALNKELQELYGAPEAEEAQNAHSFLHRAAYGSEDTVRTTFLSESELGRPLFNVRFLLET